MPNRHSAMKRGLIPPLSHLVTFACAARHQNMSRAAEELHLTQSAVSRQIAQLEHSLGVTLFDRTRKRLRLTANGESYAATVAKHLQSLESATHKLRSGDHDAAVIELGVLPTFATQWLIPRLPVFLAANPTIRIHCHTRLEPFDFAQDSLQAALHFGAPSWPDASCTHLMDEANLVVASPHLLQRFHFRSPADLAQAPLLHQATRPGSWADWFAAHRVTTERAYQGAQYDQFAMIVAAARAGLGIGVLPQVLVQDEISQGHLALAWPGAMPGSGAYYLVRPRWHTGLTSLDCFETWLTATARGEARAGLETSPAGDRQASAAVSTTRRSKRRRR